MSARSNVPGRVHAVAAVPRLGPTALRLRACPTLLLWWDGSHRSRPGARRWVETLHG